MTTLRDWREKKVMSQTDLATASGVATSTISRIETGLQKPNFVTIHKIAAALRVAPEDIKFK